MIIIIIIIKLCALQGYCPPVQAALELYRMLSEPGIDLRQPVSLENQLLTDNTDMDSEVGQSMLQLLQVLPSPSSLPSLFPSLPLPFPSLPFPSLPFPSLPSPSLPSPPPSVHFPAFSPLHCLALQNHLCTTGPYEKIPPVLSICLPGHACHQEQSVLIHLTWLTCVLQTGS